MSYDALVASGIHPMNAAALKGMPMPGMSSPAPSTYTGSESSTSGISSLAPSISYMPTTSYGTGTPEYIGGMPSASYIESMGYRGGMPTSSLFESMGYRGGMPTLSLSEGVGGLKKREGYADGGDVVAGERGMNLDRLPSLNVNTGISSLGGSSGMGGDAMYSFNDKAAMSPIARMLLPQMSQSDRAKFLGSGMGAFFGMQERPKQEYYTSSGALTSGYAQGGYLDGAGDGMSDSIPATIEGKQPARLADGEFVIPADVVSHIGNGSSKAGSKRLYAMLDKIRHARTGHTKQGKQIKAEKYLPA
jgi:hypothetical protein